MASHPKPRKSLNERKYPPHDASHQSMFCASKSPLLGVSLVDSSRPALSRRLAPLQSFARARA